MNSPIQKILFGGPGTGKSWWIDNHIIPNELGIKKEETPENIIKTVFHPEYTHGDFMGKLVPITRLERIHYDFNEGNFLKALAQAYKNIIESYDVNGKPIENCPAKKVVLVIDEINRGNSAAIFGSIFQLLDRDETGWSQYYVNVNEITLSGWVRPCVVPPKTRTAETTTMLTAFV
ncbi:MAG: restriction endonuclease, partial [Candidatus Electrothrix sp. AX5]|nr:restriction endonuclease [Candidatus Electrothrix sp. AX5]